MNEIAVTLGLAAWKPALSSLLLPPVPALLLIVLGAVFFLRHRVAGWAAIATGTAVVWLGSTVAVGDTLRVRLLDPPPPLALHRIEQLRSRVAAGARVVVVVLGGGRRSLAPEYGEAGLTAMSSERLHYGVWLSRRTDAGLMFSGGTGYAQDGGAAEAEIARRIAGTDYHRTMRWIEPDSHDTRENAIRTLAVLRGSQIDTLLIVTHDWHMPRALRDFERAAAAQPDAPTLVAAPMGQIPLAQGPLLRWLPSVDGFQMVWWAMHEWLGLIAGA
jgi:uncharacterized SAM-binding protein YcdF (DUF218 family)